MELVLATRSGHKVREIRKIMADVPDVRVVDLLVQSKRIQVPSGIESIFVESLEAIGSAVSLSWRGLAAATRQSWR